MTLSDPIFMCFHLLLIRQNPYPVNNFVIFHNFLFVLQWLGENMFVVLEEGE